MTSVLLTKTARLSIQEESSSEKERKKAYARNQVKLTRRRNKIRKELGAAVVILVESYFNSSDMTKEEFREKYNTLVEQAETDIKNVK